MHPSFLDNDHASRFEWKEEGFLAFADYRRGPGRILLTHFETEPAARGRGLAGKLMAAIWDDAHARGLKIEPRCPYAIDWFDKHPDKSALRVERLEPQEQPSA